MVYAIFNYPDNGYEADQEHAKAHLKVGEQYVVERVSMSGFHTTVYLEGNAQGFNSVHFDFTESGKEIDIYRDKRFNPYTRM